MLMIPIYTLFLPGKEDAALCEQAAAAVESCAVVCCISGQLQPLKVFIA